MRLNRKQQYSHLSKQIMNRFLVTILIAFSVLTGGYFVARFICSRFIWDGSEPLYAFFKTLEGLAPAIVLLVMTVLCIMFMLKTVKAPFQYLDDVIAAAKALPDPDAPSVSLPEELSDVENELKIVKIQLAENLRLRKEAEQRKNDLIMYLAHDLKTPLSSVLGYLTLLRDEGQISPELREKYLSIALDKAERLEDLINEFFEITRFNLSTITLQYSQIDLTRLLEQLVFEFKPMMNDKELSCNLLLPDSLPIRCDADKIQRVFDNILRNAVIYSFPNQEVAISAQQNASDVTIRFRNHGNTIPPEKLSRIFEQFYRLDAARSSSGGAGLGLAIAKQIVEQHGGVIDAVSADDKIEFTVTLPLS